MTVKKDGHQSLPYFSQPELVSRFAYTEKIRYIYYLKNGRPTYAFLSFLAEEVDKGATTLSIKRINSACGVALWIAAKNLTNTTVTSTCVAFVEMLGQDSLLLRVYIQSGMQVLHHRNSGIVGTADKKKEMTAHNENDVVDMLLRCIRRQRRNAPLLLAALEMATIETIAKKGIDSLCFEAAKHWLLPMIFCYQLCLPLSSRFLEQCAQDDKWLPFLWFAQLHQFPKQQLHSLLHHFRSRHLRDHLHYVIENADAKSALATKQASVESMAALTQSKDSRSSLYAKIGVMGRGEDEISSDDEDNMADGLRSSIHDDETVEVTMTADSAPEDVFQVVFSSQMSFAPWKSLLQAAVVLRNCLFAELAACHQEVPLAPCLCGWLVAMLDRNKHTQFLEAHGKSPSSWNMSDLDLLINIYMKHHWESTLATGFDIFQIKSPLLPFLKFIAEFLQRKNYAECKNWLGIFKDAMLNFEEDTQDKVYPSQPVLGNSHWLEHTANRLIHYMIVHANSLYEALRLVQLLDQENIALVFSFDVPDYSRLHKILQLLHDNNLIAVAVPSFLSSKQDLLRSESIKVVDSLIQMKSFNDAYKFAHLTDVSCDCITRNEMCAEKVILKNTEVWQSKVARARFWKVCSEKFKFNQTSKESVIDYFNNEAKDISSMAEKAFIYKLCLSLLGARGDPAYNDVYRQMWHYRIQARIREQRGGEEEENTDRRVEEILSVLDVSEDRKSSADKSELVNPGKMPSMRRQSQVSLDEVDACNSLIGQLLNESKICESCQVTNTFQHYSQDLAIILTCIQLSQGITDRNKMEPEMRHLLTDDRNVRASIGSFSPFSRTGSTTSLAPTAPSWDFLPVEKEDSIVVMEKLLGHCNHGQQCCLRIITAFKVACILGLLYTDIINGEEFAVLDDLLRTTYPQRFILARDYLQTSSLSDVQVASFLSVSIIKALKASIELDDQASYTKDLIFNPSEDAVMVDQFIKLCQDPSHLGHHLLEATAAMTDNSDDPQSTRRALSMHTELLIMSHSCYTVASSMEGISHVLRAARICTNNLAKAGEFTLMIRLLTGVGRYSEMTYIFDALQNHHQFELLLRKGMDRENSLKTAVLDYLKRFHPHDKDSYTMVALKFTMYREIAHMLEESGWSTLNTLRGRALENTRDIQDNLKKSSQYFSDAAESYVKDNCLRHAQQCLRQARLLVLQIQHLSSGIQFIHLSPDGIGSLIAEHPKFIESLIVSEAYGKQTNWSTAIYHNVVLNGDFRYLHDLRSHIRLTANMIQEAISRFQQSGSSTSQALVNIKKLLPFCKDIRLEYHIAEELQLNDFLSSILKSDAGSYLQDTITS